VPKPIYIAALAIAGISAPVRGQLSAPPMVSALPNVNSMTVANSVGVLEYCVQHQLVSKVSAAVVLDRLGRHTNSIASSDYQAGLSGQVRSTGGSSPFLFERAATHQKSQVCDMVLDHAKKL